jgi:SAM-dependent methyltransferase
VSPRVDFSRNADVYDRRHGTVLPESVARRLLSAAALEPDSRVLDVGAGTGRVAVALAELGADVLALEPALAMAHALRTKAAAGRVRVVAGEGARLPLPTSRFEAVVLARLLYLMRDWRTVIQEVCRVLTPRGRLLHEWGNGHAGEEWVQIREKARMLFEQSGVSEPFHPGARSELEVDEYLVRAGLIQTTEVRIGPGPGMTLSDFLTRLVSGEFSYLWNVPLAVQQKCLPQLRTWAERTFDLERVISMPDTLRWTVYQKHAG